MVVKGKHKLGHNSADCPVCPDGTGWTLWHTKDFKTGVPMSVWVACADCNDDARRPKPEVYDEP
jgi:hypothetical protein